jgi:type IV pilus assembly protein PilV
MLTNTMRRRVANRRQGQRGIMLLEALIAILIFSLGILALIGLQAQSIRNSSEAKYRADASFLANQLIGFMWSDPANFASYGHFQAGAVCAPSGSASGNANVASWLANVNALLPGAPGTLQSIVVNTATRDVTVRICWESRSGRHNVVVSTRLST